MTKRKRMDEIETYDHTEIPDKIDVLVERTGEQPVLLRECHVIGRSMKFPRIVLLYGGTVECSRETLMRCAKEGVPVRA